MRKGDIIRKKLNSGIAIGAYMIVTRAMKDRVDARPLNSMDVITLKNENIVSINMISLKMPMLDMRNIVNRDLRMYTHKSTQKWVEAANMGDVEIVRLSSQNGEEAYFSNCSFTQIFAFNPFTKMKTDRGVRMILGNLIYCDYGRRSKFWV